MIQMPDIQALKAMITAVLKTNLTIIMGKSSFSKCQQRLVDATYDRGSELEVDSGNFEEESDLCDSDFDSSPPTPPHAPHLSG